MDTPGHQGFDDSEEAATALCQTAYTIPFLKLAVRGSKA